MKLSIYLVITAFTCFIGTPDDEKTRQAHFRVTSSKLAIDGYDPVSYYLSGPVKGIKSIAYNYKGIQYWFKNDANKAEFIASPSKYEPAWGGWCGHAMALRGEKVEINPLCYKIVDGRNVLFYKTVFANALSNWEKELKQTKEGQLMKMGDEFWKALLSK